eukprot:TRINITY_DN19615_c0_g1_i1.p1 TRINITY_DN19615_c0_g1~~TRINITY_DN19615_c0_g1_i1.p1  ORF type:complete len:1766 (+),score=448.42 TRINITY_DN19615_c0_g1_i1:74-5371(+)
MIRRLDALLRAVRPGGADGGSWPRHLDGDAVLYGCDALQNGEPVWLCVTENFVRVMDAATRAVCFDLVPVVEIDAVVEQGGKLTPAADPEAVGIIKRGASADVLINVPDPAARDLFLGYVASVYATVAGRSLSLCTLPDDVRQHLRAEHTQPKPLTPFPASPHDYLRLGRNTSVRTKLTQHGDRCVEYADRVTEVVTPADVHGQTKVLIVSDAALYVTEKAGKVEYRLPLAQILSVVPAADGVVCLESHTRPPAYFRSRSAQAFMDAVTYLLQPAASRVPPVQPPPQPQHSPAAARMAPSSHEGEPTGRAGSRPPVNSPPVPPQAGVPAHAHGAGVPAPNGDVHMRALSPPAPPRLPMPVVEEEASPSKSPPRAPSVAAPVDTPPRRVGSLEYPFPSPHGAAHPQPATPPRDVAPSLRHFSPAPVPQPRTGYRPTVSPPQSVDPPEAPAAPPLPQSACVSPSVVAAHPPSLRQASVPTAPPSLCGGPSMSAPAEGLCEPVRAESLPSASDAPRPTESSPGSPSNASTAAPTGSLPRRRDEPAPLGMPPTAPPSLHSLHGHGARSLLSPETDSVLRVLEGSGRGAAALRQPAFDAWGVEHPQTHTHAHMDHLRHNGQGLYGVGELSSPTPSPYQGAGLVGDLPLPASPAEPVTCGRSQSPSVRRGLGPAPAVPLPSHPSLPELTPEAPVAFRRVSEGVVVESRSRSPDRRRDDAAARKLAETEARLTAYMEANEQLRDALEAQRAPSMDRQGSPTAGSVRDEEQHEEQLRSLLLLRDAEIEDLKEAAAQREDAAAQEKASSTRRKGRLSVPSLAKKPTRMEERLTAKTKLADAAVQFAKVVEKRLVRLSEQGYEQRVRVLEGLLQRVAGDAPEVAAEIGLDAEGERVERLANLGETEARRQLAAREYQVAELKRQVKGLVEEGRRLAQDSEAARDRGQRVAHDVVKKAKEKAEELAFEASTVKLELNAAHALVEKLQGELKAKDQEAARRQQETEKRCMVQESELRRAYETRLAKVEERTQAYERKLARTQSQLLQDLHAKELELQHYLQGLRAPHGAEGVQDLQAELARSKAVAEHLESQLSIANMQLEALCVEQARVAAETHAYRGQGDAAEVADLRDKLAARDGLVKALRDELSRWTPPATHGAAQDPMGAPYAAVRRFREQEADVMAVHEANRALQSEVDEGTSQYTLALNKIGALEEQLSSAQRLGEVALAKAQQDAVEARREALDAAAKLEAGVVATETGAYLSAAAKHGLEARADTAGDAVREELLRCKAQLVKVQEQADRETAGARHQARGAKAHAKQLSEAKLELESKQNTIAAQEEELKRVQMRCVELKKRVEHAEKDAQMHAHEAAEAQQQLEALEGSQETQRVKEMEAQLVRATNQFNELDAHVAMERTGWEGERLELDDTRKACKQLQEKCAEQAAQLAAAQQALAAQQQQHERRYQDNIRSSIAMAMEEMQRGEQHRRPAAPPAAPASAQPWLAHIHRNGPDAGGIVESPGAPSPLGAPRSIEDTLEPSTAGGYRGVPGDAKDDVAAPSVAPSREASEESPWQGGALRRGTTPRRQVPPHSPHTDVAGAAPQPAGDGGALTLKALGGGADGDDGTADRVAQIHKNLQEGGLVDESRINRCVERLYNVYNQRGTAERAERPAEPKVAPLPSRAKQVGAREGRPQGGQGGQGGYAQRYKGKEPPAAPARPERRANSAAAPGKREIAAAARDGKPAPAGGCLPPSFSGGAGVRSSETAALYAQLGLSDLAPYAAT